MTEITFTGNLDQITNMIDSYKLKGYVYKSHTEQSIEYLAHGQKRKMILYSVVMKRMWNHNPENTIPVFSEGKPNGVPPVWNAMLKIVDEIKRWHPEASLQEQLSEAVEREDYETAAILRDKIKDTLG
jgi:hypothetical protein